MSNYSLRAAAAVWVGMVFLATAQNLPRIGYVFPAGGKPGSTFQVRLGGQFLEGATNLVVSGSGAQTVVLDYAKPLSPKEFSLQKDKFKELQDKRTAAFPKTFQRRQTGLTNSLWTAADERLLAEVKKKLSNPPDRKANPALVEVVTATITLDPTADPGDREIRVSGAYGLSNPLLFKVGQFPEVTEKESKFSKAATETAVTLPATINGQIMPGDVDRYRFHARLGQRIVVTVAARELIPYLPDAVPGWFQATLALRDARGQEVSYADDFRFNPDPVLAYEIPRDGDYSIEVKDAIYRGREDFVYRITVGELPFITSIFPLGGPADAPSVVELKGWNLPVNQLTVPARAPGRTVLTVKKGDLVSNRMTFAGDLLPEVAEQEPNQTPGAAVTLPVIINGRIGQPGDRDVFRVEGRAGQRLVADVMARRLNSPLDSVLRITDATGRILVMNDDHEDKGSGLSTHHADSYLAFDFPSNGTYFVHLADAQSQGGPEYGYRLRLSEPQPDFELRVAPSTLNVRSGAAAPLTLYVQRKDGFTNAIDISLSNAPAGFALGGATIPAGQDGVRLTLSTPVMLGRAPVNVSLQGRALIQGRAVVRGVLPAEDMMQAFIYRHLVPAQNLAVAGLGRTLGKGGGARLLTKGTLSIPVGGTASVEIDAPALRFSDKIHLELSDPPEGITIKNVTSSRFGSQIILQADPDKTKAGLRGNLIVNAFTSKEGGAGTGGKKRPPTATLPAIPFETVKR
jgi:hypothetical protein